MATSKPTRGLIALLRLPYWLMTGGLSLLTAFAITRKPFSLSIQTDLLIFFSMAFITSAGFAINDYFDRESDAVIKPKRPIPSGALSLKQVVAVSSVLFVAGLILASYINWLSFAIIAARFCPSSGLLNSREAQIRLCSECFSGHFNWYRLYVWRSHNHHPSDG